MRAADAARIALSVVGLVALVRAVSMISGIQMIAFQTVTAWEQRAILLLAYVVPFALLLFLAGYLLRNAEAIAGRNFPAREAPSDPLRGEELERILYATVGLFTLLGWIPSVLSVVGALVSMTVLREQGRLESDGLLRGEIIHDVGIVLSATLGAYLFLRPEGAVRLRRRLGRREPPPPSAAVDPTCPSCGHPFHPSDYREDAVARLCSRCKEPLPPEAFSGVASPA